MSSGHDGDDELFARVWEQRDATGHPVRPAHPDPRAGDPELARVLDVAAALRSAGRDTPGPDAAASARMRAAVMAEITGGAADADAPRERTRVLRSATDSGPAGGRGAGRTGEGARRPARRGSNRPADARPAARASSRRPATRLLSSLVTGACAVLLLGALTVLLSRGALPGEMLYGIKRASESAELGLTSGQEAKGLKHLEFAAIRLEEVSDLVGRSGTTAAGAGPVAAGLDTDQAGLVLENLRSFDEQARTGSRLILPLAAQPTGPSPAELAEWARTQSARLDTLRPSLDEDGRTAAAGSQQMLQRLSQRATVLGGPERCEAGTASDDLGPLPTGDCEEGTDATTAAPVTPTETSTSTTSSTTTTTTTTTTTRSEESSTGTGDENSARSTSETREERTSQPDPVQVPLPVPLLPQVDVPPLLPGLPGLSLG
ncbi:DUF5667 domain-containing protein [Actinomycetospora cinnamomea]|uniref:DUF5667 domain-containing protein n=1 Tax=Actinomycetospora cinnamomea TaxID=663609 RepID=A0A2U1FDP4_9PSEU|nr:DUF5667 domain-containing protein [Actinomycetospora cinnamomea]PVZ10080.1 hypothetical protein C8D89_105156 [Actinomycetospora cinnamomea]